LRIHLLCAALARPPLALMRRTPDNPERKRGDAVLPNRPLAYAQGYPECGQRRPDLPMTKKDLELATHNLVRRLLDARNADGHWEGRLASSALSTATAIVALSLTDRRGFDGPIT